MTALLLAVLLGNVPCDGTDNYANVECLPTDNPSVTGDLTVAGKVTASGGFELDSDDTCFAMGAALETDYCLKFDGTDARYYTSGVHRFDAPIVAGRWEIDADSGSIRYLNQNLTSSLADGTEVCLWSGLDNTNGFGVCAEADGSDGIDEKSYQFEGMNGAIKKCTRDQTTLTFASGGGDANKTWTGAVPVGGTEFFYTTRTLVAGTGCTDADYGVAADTNAYADAVALTVGTTTDPSDYTANVNSNVITTAADFVITGTDGAGGAANCVDLSVRVEAFYCTYSAPTN